MLTVGHEVRRENEMTVGYAYLDHNVVDRIDTPLRDALLCFFQENELTPVVSTASLGEIERSGRADRVEACITALLGIGSQFILENDSCIHVVQLSVEQIQDLLASKNTLVADTVSAVNAAQFYLISATSRNELEQRLSEINKDIQALIRLHDGAKTAESLLELMRLMDAIKIGGIPDKFNWARELRSRLGIDPQEINNLRPKDLWRIIEEATLTNGASLPFDASTGPICERIYNALMALNALGYWADGIDSSARQMAFNYDCMHGIYGAICHAIISSDKRFLRRLRAAYHYLGIGTRTVFVRAGHTIEEGD